MMISFLQVFGYDAKKYMSFVHKVEAIDGSQMSGTNVNILTQKFIDKLLPIFVLIHFAILLTLT
jgi:hypothetical protein